MLISKKIRLEVSSQDAATLEFMQGKCRGLYNWWVMRLRNGEKWPGWEKAKKTLQESREHDPELKFVYGKCLQEVYFRLDGAMKAFFRRVKNGEKPGFPRVRPRHCFFTLIYPAMKLLIQTSNAACAASYAQEVRSECTSRSKVCPSRFQPGARATKTNAILMWLPGLPRKHQRATRM